ncbi:MAG: MupA/Atu3671 family FMN-dependent luciferase-like monooxygenase [Verrucomicrobiota bacterium]
MKWPAFSLLFFASQPADFERGKFELFRASTRFADERGFEAVWIPERHFHAFGGLFPNPSLAAVVLAESTRRIRIRAGSVVMPLHHPIRVAEEWAVVDNLSHGRVDLSFAIGWNVNDFVLAPQHYADRKRITLEGIDSVRRLWRGETYQTPNGRGEPTAVTVHPLPVQKDLEIWFTCSGGAERYGEAGGWGFHVLTALLFQGIDELAPKIAAYRQARAAAGVPGPGKVTLMLHTYLGPDEAEVKNTVREPFKRYLESSADLWQAGEERLRNLSPRKKADMLEYAFERYYQKTGLMGSPESARRMVEAVAAVGVDEIACLIDFGLPFDRIMDGLEHLDILRRAGPVPPA